MIFFYKRVTFFWGTQQFKDSQVFLKSYTDESLEDASTNEELSKHCLSAAILRKAFTEIIQFDDFAKYIFDR